ncbi:MAG: dipicolinate synthase subunit A [Ruminococcus flavefaciens]|nr:dipicolinate synthase subunit A [Ruminococcus flavefaciens]MCM1228552.1 dipicolinate synthase subunit A [Ruminococcus flavefaciens]
MSKINILIAGGDMRQVFCAEKLADIYNVEVIGIDRDFTAKDFHGRKCGCVVLPVPPFDENGNINTPCSDDIIPPGRLKEFTTDDCIVFTGRYDKRLEDLFPQSRIIDYMSCEDLSLKNAVPTAEGAVQLALEELPVTLNGLSVLIVGIGRIGTALAEILKGFGADITVAVRNSKGTGKARVIGVKSVCTKDMGTDYGLVFNTAPELVFSREILKKFSSDTLFIDLASRPGGFDFESASELGRKVIWALGLPGKTAPVTAGEFVAETIINILEGGFTDE